MSGFSGGFIFAIAVTTALLFLVGWFLWHRMFVAKTEFSKGNRFADAIGGQTPDAKIGTNIAEDREALSVKESLPPTVSSQETISNSSDDAVVDVQTQELSSQQTVENTGDASVSMDDEEQQKG